MAWNHRINHTLAFFFLAILTTGCAQQLSQAKIDRLVDSKVTAKLNEMEAREEENKKAIQSILNSFVSGDTTVLDRYVHPEFTNHFAPKGLQDRDGFYQIHKQVRAIFSQFEKIELKPAILFAKGDYVAMVDNGEGLRNGKQYKHVDFHIFKMKDGKMYEHWNSFGLPSQRDMLMKFMEESQ